MYARLSPPRAAVMAHSTGVRDLGKTWKRFDHGVKAHSTMMSVGLHPRDPNQVYCATRGGQVFGTQDGGASWHEYRLPENIQDVYIVACA